MRSLAAGALVVLTLALPAGANTVPSAPGCPLFPADNYWHADVSGLAVHERSAAWLSNMGGPTRRIHADFGPSETSTPYGIPYEVVDASRQKVSVSFTYADESDPGPYPFGPETPIEGGPDATGDRHALMLHKNECVLYELFDARYSASGSTAGSGAVYDLGSNALRPAGWTSADAAGLPILPGLVRLDEVQAGAVDHAVRMTALATDRTYIWPARHQAGAQDDPNLPPMGAWFRLMESFDISGFRPDSQVILRAMKKHGLILADNGSNWFFTGTAENGWSTDMIGEIGTITASNFEAVDTSSLVVDPNSGQVRGAPAGPPFTGVDLPPVDLYFAEGTTRPGFVTYLTIANPSLSRASDVVFEYHFASGSPVVTQKTVAAGTRLTVNVNEEVGAGRDVSTRVRVTGGPGVVAERPVYVRGRVAALELDGGDVATGVAEAAPLWMFAEGTTRAGFQEYLSIQNPSDAGPATVIISYPGAPGEATLLVVASRSRATVDVNEEVGPGRDVGAVLAVESGPNVVAERPLYFAADVGLGPVHGVSDALGALRARADWYFAEGTTRTGFREFLSIQNPSPTETAQVRIDYLGTPAPPTTLSLSPASRQTVDVNAAIGPERDVAAAVHVVSGPDVVAERPMYVARSFGGPEIRGGHDAPGSAGPRTRWIFAEGTTRAGFAEYLTLQNPGASVSNVVVHFRFAPGQGSPVSLLYDVAPEGRTTVDVRAAAGTGKDVAVIVEVLSGPPVVAERPMYFAADAGAGQVTGASVAAGV